MALDYILRRFAKKTGIKCFSTPVNVEQRQDALDYINEACRELWEASDLHGSLEETTLVVFDSKQISLPSFVDVPRALRESQTEVPWRLSDIRPQYHENSWSEQAVRNWRDKGDSPIARDIVNTAPLRIVIPFVENPPVVITIVGSTVDATSVSESVVLNSLVTNTLTSFTDITSIKKDRVNTCDVLIQDVDKVDLSIIYNNSTFARFKYIDAGAYFIQDGPFTLDVLYKKKLNDLINNEDEFPVNGYDDVIINKALQLWAEDKGSVDVAGLYDKKAERTSERKTSNQNKGQDHVVEFQASAGQGVFADMRRRRR